MQHTKGNAGGDGKTGPGGIVMEVGMEEGGWGGGEVGGMESGEVGVGLLMHNCKSSIDTENGL